MAETDFSSKASEPKSVSVDGQSVVNRDGRDAIELDKYASAKTAMKSRRFGLWFCKIRPPGAT